MEVSTEKSKVMLNSREEACAKITMNGEALENVDKFKYLGATLTKDGSSIQEIRIRIASATSAMTRLSKIWQSSNISFKTKYRLFRSLVISIFLYGCETWTVLKESEKRIQSFENKCHRKLLGISWRERKTNEHVQEKMKSLVGQQEPLLATVKRRKLQWFGHISRHNSLAKTIMQGTLAGQRTRGRPRKNWQHNIVQWTGLESNYLLKAASSRIEWRKISAKASLQSPQRPSRSRE